MSRKVIEACGLGKKYQVGRNPQGMRRYQTLRESLTTGAQQLFRRNGSKQESDGGDFWALRDINFEVEEGEVVGVIGRNGAGKSTLLKILSRITEPTTGKVQIKGRVASLLEVGTGFHPELTGRENIFLNGAILGMSRAEIKAKFDEIVAFAEVQRFLDTPVKRYSSGMYVRLAFAVAAHLEPEILVIDEVLAVGDMEFQKKCLGKMESVSKEQGRTVLFVSHNMAAVNSLTSSAILLDGGRSIYRGPSSEAIERYIAETKTAAGNTSHWGTGRHTRITSALLLNAQGEPSGEYRPGSDLVVDIILETDGYPAMSIELFLKDEMDHTLALASLHQFHAQSLPTVPGTYSCRLQLGQLWLASGRYTIKAATSVVNAQWDHIIEDAIQFEVPFSNPRSLSWDFKQSYGFGAIALPFVQPPMFSEITSHSTAAPAAAAAAVSS